MRGEKEPRVSQFPGKASRKLIARQVESLPGTVYTSCPIWEQLLADLGFTTMPRPHHLIRWLSMCGISENPNILFLIHDWAVPV